jgi:hypothetical protein
MHSPYRLGVMKAASDGSAFRFTETYGRYTSSHARCGEQLRGYSGFRNGTAILSCLRLKN